MTISLWTGVARMGLGRVRQREAYFKSVAAKGVSPKAVKAMKGIAEEVTKLIEERQLQPMIRTSYYRSAFQLATDNKA
eukprot:1927846-Amphidinium_carterae.1